jgi:hypothetical protein
MAEMTVDAEYHTRPGNTPETVCRPCHRCLADVSRPVFSSVERLAVKFVDLHLYFQRPSTASYPSGGIYEVVLASAFVVSVPEVNRLQFLQQFF